MSKTILDEKELDEYNQEYRNERELARRQYNKEYRDAHKESQKKWTNTKL